MIKLCIFDMDGLLIDSERYMWHESMTIAASEQGRVMTEEFHKSIMGLNHKDETVLMKKVYGEDFNPDIFYERVYELNQEIMKKGIPLMKGAKELLDYLHKAGIKTCIGTSTPRQTAERILKIEGIYEDFDDMVCGDEVVSGKPNPEIYLKCFSKFDVKKEEALIFEDANSGGLAALAAGIRLVLVPDLATLTPEVLNGAYKVIEDLSKIIDIIKEENERATSV